MSFDNREQPPYPRELSVLVQKAVARLAEMPPEAVEILTPQAIRQAHPGVYERILAFLPPKPVGKRPERDWGLFARVLAAEHPLWHERWDTPERQRERAIIRQAGRVVELLRARRWSEPLKLSVLRGLYSNYQNLSRLLPPSTTHPRERDWSPFVKHLEEFAPLWDDRTAQKEQALAKAVGELAAWFKGRSLKTGMRKVLRAKNQALDRRLGRLASDPDIGWKGIVNHPLFPPEWREYWHSKRSGQFNPRDITRARKWLQKTKPEFFGPASIINRLGQAIYERLLNHLPRRDGRADWRPFLEALDADQPPESRWSARWRGQLEERPKAGEPFGVEVALAPYRDSLGAVVAPRTAEDVERRETIVKILVNLLRSGNQEALQSLRRLLSPLIQEWVESDPALGFYKENHKDLDQVFDYCAASFQPVRHGSFINYLREQMRLRAEVGHGRSGTLL